MQTNWSRAMNNQEILDNAPCDDWGGVTHCMPLPKKPGVR